MWNKLTFGWFLLLTLTFAWLAYDTHSILMGVGMVVFGAASIVSWDKLMNNNQV
jgi:hypothetical protein